MISKDKAKHYCKDDISLIENYQQAIEDKEMWVVHHRLELKCPMYKPSSSELIVFGLYYDRPASELIFMKSSDHRALHNKYYKASEKTKKKIAKTMKEKWQNKEYAEHMSDAHKDKKGFWEGKRMSEEHRKKLSEAHKGKIPWNKKIK